MKVVFFGTPDVAAHHLEALKDSQYQIVGIVTKPDRPQGRALKLMPPAVKVTASKLFSDVPLFQPEKCSTEEMIETLKSLGADLFVVVSYGEILSQALLDAAPFGAINVHFSLLPKLRGASPMVRSLMQGDLETGISIIRLVRKMDAGDVLGVEKMTIPPEMNVGVLEEHLTKLGIKCLLKVLADFENNQVIATPQDHAEATFAEKITPEECHIHWERPANELHNLIRALSPYPGAWCEVFIRGEKRRLKVFQAEVVQDSNMQQALIVPCQESYLRLKVIQVEGKPKMPVEEFLKGTPASQITFQR